MSTAFASVAPKIAKLLPRLASNHDGEVIATVRAIRRTLEGAGADLHTLAATVAGGGSDQQRRDEIEPDWRDIVTRLLRRSEDLDDREYAFVVNMARFIRAGSAPTHRQGEWLLWIVEKVLGGSL